MDIFEEGRKIVDREWNRRIADWPMCTLYHAISDLEYAVLFGQCRKEHASKRINEIVKEAKRINGIAPDGKTRIERSE